MVVNYDIKRVHNRLLEMSINVVSILEKENIDYILAYGTLLGAVRHEGFIPWDTDFDIIIFDEYYDRAIDILRERLPDDLFLEDSISEPNYFHAWAHVKDLTTEVIPIVSNQDSIYAHKGLQLDLYRGYKVKRSELVEFQYIQNELYLSRRMKSKTLTAHEAEIKRKNKIIENEELSALLKKENKNNNDTVVALVLFYKCKKLELEDIYPLKRYVFENHTYWGPNDAEKILENIYGNWRVLPPVEKRSSNILQVIFRG